LRAPAAALALVLAGCGPQAGEPAAERPGTLEFRRQVWAAIEAEAPARGLDARFVYALVKSESDFDPQARRGEARGLLQFKPGAWRAASDLPYGTSVWDWRASLAVGIGRLAALKSRLEARGLFSYPVLWACSHYGFEFVEARGFDLSRIPRPSDPTSYRLFRGDIHPLPPP
jgi:hypothetical protein